MAEAIILGSRRTAIGRAYKGSLVATRPDDMLADVTRALLGSIPDLDPTRIDEFLLGCSLASGEQGGNLGRVVPVMLGLDGVPGSTVNRYCASSMQTTRSAHHAIRNGDGAVYLSMGLEAVSRIGSRGPDPVEDERHPMFRGLVPSSPWSDPRTHGAVPDVFVGMGLTAENVADLHSVSRLEMDEFAVRSHELAIAARDSGFWDDEIVPVERADGSTFDRDEGPRAGSSIEALAGLKPAFRENGRVTAGNSCPLNDGAAGLVIVDETVASEIDSPLKARIVSTAVHALSPEIMGIATVGAARRALHRAQLSIDDIGVVEINEAFAAMVVPTYRELGVPLEKVNPFGGALALGHSFGMSGARITGTLLRGMRSRGARYGLQTMCVAGGQGMAMVVELLE
ncbi:acetyl-CoA C-acyltransferase [Rhodococcoides yunnanense]|uniref:acetyl-CoA C-acyltransferase n=1 Tax=Rhodococcoides yunnanense TaxID=278209 RepID=UPI0009324538|nr:acetyl-CoA C-acyltransferase [Rhodococcus yunnanensis]